MFVFPGHFCISAVLLYTKLAASVMYLRFLGSSADFKLDAYECEAYPVAARKDYASAAVQAVIANLPKLSSISGGGGLIQTTFG